MNPRRHLLAAFGACVLVAPLAAIAQAPRMYRIGWISLGKSGVASPFLDAFRQGLEERGYVEGRNVVVDARLSDGSRERADQMVVDLVQSKVDIIVTQGGAVWSAYAHAGRTPVVMGYSGDPVAARFVETLARPGGTRTGMSFLALELVGKRLEVLAQILPAGSRVAIIADPEHPGEQTELRHSQAAAQRVGMKLGYFPVHSVEELNVALKTISGDATQAIVAFPDAFTLDQREKIAAFGLKYRLPTVSGWSAFAESGFLMTYGPNLRDSYAHLATYVDKILKGAKPADLPVELPTSVEFVVNAKTAKAIGVDLPQAMLVRANSVIE
jgi:putative tryptophan/tyrosine transport system substrate-binding protein